MRCENRSVFNDFSISIVILCATSNAVLYHTKSFFTYIAPYIQELLSLFHIDTPLLLGQNLMYDQLGIIF